MKEPPESFLPLQPAALHILLALAGEDRHGYGIMQEIARQPGDRSKLGPGTLYDNRQRLLDQGLVEPVKRSGSDPRRRYYRLTSLGQGVLSAEVTRLEGITREARLYLPIPKARHA